MIKTFVGFDLPKVTIPLITFDRVKCHEEW